MSLFWSTPPRQRGVEILDDPRTPDDARASAMRDLMRSNAMFGGTRPLRRILRDAYGSLGAAPVLLDVGTGMGDIAESLASDAASAGVTLRTVGVDASPFQVTLARHRLTHGVAGDALHLPFADDCADAVICSQVLHHFFDADPGRLIRELHRVSRDWVVISDLRRSRLAAAGFNLAGLMLGFDETTVIDGATSVMRGFTTDELSRLVFDATGVRATMRSSRFWRLTATWRKSASR